jgi:hypothetical protein
MASAPDLIQSAADQFAMEIAAGNAREIAFNLLHAAAFELAKQGFDDMKTVEHAVGAEFLERLSLRWRGADDERIAIAMRYVTAMIDMSFPRYQ